MRFGEKNYNASGQVLIVGLIIVLILLLTIFIFFDIHNIIRAKIKVETAEQAAALAGARWQGESLNLIGELNLLIANEAILNSSAVQTPAGIVEIRNRMSAGVKAINELQTRVAFMGPLIGLSAAQQAAKNNGISAKNSGYDIDLYRFSIENNEPEEQSKYPDKVNGFLWKTPYKSMLSDIYFSGVAVRPSGNANGIENIQPQFLADETFYHAVLGAHQGGRVWCHYWLRILVKKPDSYFEGKSWYMPDYLDLQKHFIKQSEIYSLYVNLDESNLMLDYYEDFINLLNRPGVAVLAEFEPNNIFNDIPDRSLCRFFIYDNRYYPNRFGYNGPDVFSNYSMWHKGLWLRGELKKNFVFGGAVAYAEAEQNTAVVTNFKSGKNSKEKIQELAQEKQLYQVHIGGNFGAVAKAFSSKYNPIDVPIVSPIFDEVTLIPGTLHGVRRFSMTIPFVEKFIKYLAEFNVDIHQPVPEPPAGTDFMLEALQIMADPNFRRLGYNVDFPGLETIDYKLLFGDSYKYPERKNGAGWLQQACVRNMKNPPPDAKEGRIYIYTHDIGEALNEKLRKEYEKSNHTKPLIQYMVPEVNEEWIFYGDRYLIRLNGKILDNENDPYEGCGAFYGNGGSSGNVNTGPSHL